MKTIAQSLFLVICFVTCSSEIESVQEKAIAKKHQDALTSPILNPKGTNLEERFNPPAAYQRIKIESGTFAHYLRTIPLKKSDAKVSYYDGTTKQSKGVYTAVVDLAIGKRDLHQCADAVMRLKAEHHWKAKEYDKIYFNFTNGFRVDYTEWMKGRRVVVDGNKTYWNNRSNPSNTYQDFWKYMELVFAYAGTASLSKELQSVNYEDMQIGDIFIQGGFPGHAVIVMDMAEHPATGKKCFLLAQSYMPAQEIQILVNPNNSTFSPWYELNQGEELKTPEWAFLKGDLMRFVE